MKIDPDHERVPSARRRWGVPLAVATGVTVVSVTAVAVLGGTGEAKSGVAGRPLGSASAAAPSPSASASARESAPADPKGYTIDAATTTPIPAGSVAKILSSCLGADAARFHSVLAVRTSVRSADVDGVVVAVDSAGAYAQCQTRGDRGSSTSHPATFINDRLWSTDRRIEYFDSARERVDPTRFLLTGAGHYASDVAKITVSYGEKAREYPVLMSGGAFFYAAGLTPDAPTKRTYAGPDPHLHAYDASGKEIYSQLKDPVFQ
ncbi:hypothetical protein [Streptomyces sp. NPDC088785]|uniref:hypothetical protein n=1 Tax=Streptomyces sp. NPDC088785 TaxID=3365897 RepID=UPI003824DDBF